MAVTRKAELKREVGYICALRELIQCAAQAQHRLITIKRNSLGPRETMSKVDRRHSDFGRYLHQGQSPVGTAVEDGLGSPLAVWVNHGYQSRFVFAVLNYGNAERVRGELLERPAQLLGLHLRS